MLSAAGQPMIGYPVSWAGSSHGDETATTSDGGVASLSVATVAAGNIVTAHATWSGQSLNCGKTSPESSLSQPARRLVRSRSCRR